jgi:hypothetical protein
MRAAYIGNLGEGSAPHSTENEIAKALEAIGVEVLPFHEQRFSWAHSQVPDVDFVLWTHTHGYAPPRTHGRQSRFLEAMRRRDIPTVAYHLDRWWDLQREYQVTQEPFFRCALVCTADGGNQTRWRDAGVEHVWFPPAVSEMECQPGNPRPEYTSDIAFVGSWQGGYHPESAHRAQLIDFLRTTYGDRCAFWPEAGRHAVRGQDLRDLYASVKVLVGDSCLAGTGKNAFYLSDRIPESVGRGGFLIHPRVEGVTDGALYTDGEHLWCWDAGKWDQLASVINAALADDKERRRVATQGRNHVLYAHTYTVRMAQLVKLLYDRGLLSGPPPAVHLVGESGPETFLPPEADETVPA